MTDRLISEQALRNELELNTKWINSQYTDICIRRTPTAQMPAEAAAEYESARARAHNLNLYLEYILREHVNPRARAEIFEHFSGMPGYSADEAMEEADDDQRTGD